MTEKNDGGPAFPVAAEGAYIPDCENPSNSPAREFPGHSGMTLRDWFAGQAMAGFISDAESLGAMATIAKKEGIILEKYLASSAYIAADAMISERSK